MPLAFFQWCEETGFGQAIRDSTWAFPVIEAIHLLGLSLLGGALLIVDLRLLGTGLRRQSIAEVAVAARPWLVGSLAVMGLTGISLFMSEAVKCYYNPSFWVKMTTLPIALGYTFLVKHPIAKRPTLETGAITRLLAIGSLGLWFTVAAAGRWIGFSS